MINLKKFDEKLNENTEKNYYSIDKKEKKS